MLAYPHVKFVNLCSQVMKMAPAEAPCAFQVTLEGQLPDKQTRKTYTWRHAAKQPLFLSSCISGRPLQTVADHTLLQIWKLWTTLTIRYIASLSN